MKEALACPHMPSCFHHLELYNSEASVGDTRGCLGAVGVNTHSRRSASAAGAHWSHEAHVQSRCHMIRLPVWRLKYQLLVRGECGTLVSPLLYLLFSHFLMVCSSTGGQQPGAGFIWRRFLECVHTLNLLRHVCLSHSPEFFSDVLTNLQSPTGST